MKVDSERLDQGVGLALVTTPTRTVGCGQLDDPVACGAEVVESGGRRAMPCVTPKRIGHQQVTNCVIRPAGDDGRLSSGAEARSARSRCPGPKHVDEETAG